LKTGASEKYYDAELSLTGERGINKSATKNPQVRRLKWKSTAGVDKKAGLSCGRTFLIISRVCQLEPC
jgi:hypothetical protein